MKNIRENKPKTDYSKLIKYYKRKLIDYGAMRELKNSYISEGKWNSRDVPFRSKMKRKGQTSEY